MKHIKTKRKSDRRNPNTFTEAVERTDFETPGDRIHVDFFIMYLYHRQLRKCALLFFSLSIYARTRICIQCVWLPLSRV